MNNSEKRANRYSKNNKVNGWKWAFISLAVIIISLFLLLVRALQPVEVSAPNRQANETPQDAIELSTSMNKKDTEQLINTYLTYAAGEEYENYYIALTDQLEIHGSLEFLGFEVPFSLFLDPYVMEDGNVQLRGETVEISNFSLPVSMVMRLLGNQVDFPDFIAFNSDSQIIVVNLNELTKNYNFDIEMTTIDLVDSVIELNLQFDENTILEQIQMERTNEPFRE